MEYGTLMSKFRIPSSEALMCRDVKCIRWPEWDWEELFDLKSDPLEQYNLIADPAQADRLAALHSRFGDLQKEAR